MINLIKAIYEVLGMTKIVIYSYILIWILLSIFLGQSAFALIWLITFVVGLLNLICLIFTECDRYLHEVIFDIYNYIKNNVIAIINKKKELDTLKKGLDNEGEEGYKE